jgi:hypothetical protein
MEPIVRRVRDIDPNERRMLEHFLGRQLHDNQDVIVEVVTPGNQPDEDQVLPQPGKLPDWCNVFEDLPEEQIGEIEQVILQRSNLTRPSR